MTQRLTLKLSGAGKLLVEHFDLADPVSETEFRAAAESVAERLGKKVAARPAETNRKKTAARAKVDV